MSLLLLSWCFVLLASCRYLLWIQGGVAQPGPHAAGPLALAERDRIGCNAGRAPAPVDDLGFIDLVAQVVGSRQAGGVAHRAVDIGDGATVSADKMVMVVADAELVQPRLAGRLDTPYQSHVGQRVQDIVYRLGRAVPETLAHGADDRIDARMRRAGRKRREHRQPRGGDAKAGPAQGGSQIRRTGIHRVGSSAFRLRVRDLPDGSRVG